MKSVKYSTLSQSLVNFTNIHGTLIILCNFYEKTQSTTIINLFLFTTLDKTSQLVFP